MYAASITIYQDFHDDSRVSKSGKEQFPFNGKKIKAQKRKKEERNRHIQYDMFTSTEDVQLKLSGSAKLANEMRENCQWVFTGCLLFFILNQKQFTNNCHNQLMSWRKKLKGRI